MKSILRVNTHLLTNNVEEKEFSNDIALSENMILTPT